MVRCHCFQKVARFSPYYMAMHGCTPLEYAGIPRWLEKHNKDWIVDARIDLSTVADVTRRMIAV
jgi:hypothetical protein